MKPGELSEWTKRAGVESGMALGKNVAQRPPGGLGMDGEVGFSKFRQKRTAGYVRPTVSQGQHVTKVVNAT